MAAAEQEDGGGEALEALLQQAVAPQVGGGGGAQRDALLPALGGCDTPLTKTPPAQILDELARGCDSSHCQVPPHALASARTAYAQLQRAALRAAADLAALHGRARALLAQLAQVEVQGEVAEMYGLDDPVQVLDKFREDRGRAASEVRRGAAGGRLGSGWGRCARQTPA